MKGIHETVKKIFAYEPKSYATGTYNNGATGTVTNGIDVKGVDEVLIALIMGVFTATGTVTLSVFHNDTNTTTGAVAVTDAAGNAMAMTVKAVAQDQAEYVGRLKGQNLKRYLFVRCVVATDVGIFGVTVDLQGQRNGRPISQENTVEFTH